MKLAQWAQKMAKAEILWPRPPTRGTALEECLLARSRARLAGLFARGLFNESDAAAAASSLKAVRVHALADQDNAPETRIVFASGK
jgi:hypothetical protein